MEEATKKLKKVITLRKEDISDIEILGDKGKDGLDGQKGEQGIQGIQGEKGDKGDTGLPGKDGLNGLDGKDGVDGEKGDQGDKGLDGSPDTSEQIAEKLNQLKDALDPDTIKGFRELERIAKTNAFNPTMGPSFSDLSNLSKRVDAIDKEGSIIVGTPTQIAFFDPITGDLTSDASMIHDLSSNILLTIQGSQDINLSSITGSVQTNITLGSQAGNPASWTGSNAGKQAQITLYDAGQIPAPLLRVDDPANSIISQLGFDSTSHIFGQWSDGFTFDNSNLSINATRAELLYQVGSGNFPLYSVGGYTTKAEILATDNTGVLSSVVADTAQVIASFTDSSTYSSHLDLNSTTAQLGYTDLLTGYLLGFKSDSNLSRMGGIDSNYRVAIETNSTEKKANIVGTYAIGSPNPPAFSGSGTDDLNYSGAFSGTVGTSYSATVDGNDINLMTSSVVLGGAITPNVDYVKGNTSGAYGLFLGYNSDLSLVLMGVLGDFTFSENATVYNGNPTTVGVPTGTILNVTGQSANHADTITFTDGFTVNTWQNIQGGVGAIRGVACGAPTATGHTIGDSWSWSYSFAGMKTFTTDYLAGFTAIGDPENQVTGTHMTIDWVNKNTVIQNTGLTTIGDVITGNAYFQISPSSQIASAHMSDGVTYSSDILLQSDRTNISFDNITNISNGYFRLFPNGISTDAVLQMASTTWDGNIILDATSTRIQRNAGGETGTFVMDPASSSVRTTLTDSGTFDGSIAIGNLGAALNYSNLAGTSSFLSVGATVITSQTTDGTAINSYVADLTNTLISLTNGTTFFGQYQMDATQLNPAYVDTVTGNIAQTIYNNASVNTSYTENALGITSNFYASPTFAQVNWADAVNGITTQATYGSTGVSVSTTDGVNYSSSSGLISSEANLIFTDLNTGNFSGIRAQTNEVVTGLEMGGVGMGIVVLGTFESISMIGGYASSANSRYFVSQYKNDGTVGETKFGDLDGELNGTIQKLDDVSQIITMESLGTVGLSLDFANGIASMGIVTTLIASAGIRLDTAGGQYQFGSGAIVGNGTNISIDDVNQLITLRNIPSYADDATATGAGLTTGQLYKTTVLGSTFLKIVP